MMMNKLNGIAVGIVLLLLNCAVVEAKNKSSKTIEMKCHVEVVGGRDLIHFINVKSNQKQTFKSDLVGQKINTYAIKGEQVIYKVKECVNLNDNFDTAAAKSADIFAVR